MADGATASLIKRKSSSVPIAAAAHLLELAKNPFFVFVFPFPDSFDKLFATEVVARLAFVFLEPLFDDGLSGDPGMIGSGHPERIKSLHPLHPNQNVLQRIVERVAKMQRTGNVGGRDDDRVRLARRIGGGVEVPAILPHL